MDTFTKYNKAMETIKFRDKLTKLVQYASRAIKYYLLAADPKSEWGQRFDGLYCTSQLGLALHHTPLLHPAKVVVECVAGLCV